MNWEDLVLAGLDAVHRFDGIQWELGDLALQVETHHGEHSLERYAKQIGVEYRTLDDYRRVAKAFGFPDRSGNLSWTHHQRVAARPDRLEWLARATKHGWSTSKFQDEVRLADNPSVPTNLVQQLKQEVTAGTTPVEAATDAIKKYGPLPPAVAREVARELDISYVPGSDNQLYDARPEEQIEREGADIARLGGMYRAIQHLAKQMGPPEAEALAVPSYMETEVEPYLPAAVEWLLAFQQAWRRKWSRTTSE